MHPENPASDTTRRGRRWLRRALIAAFGVALLALAGRSVVVRVRPSPKPVAAPGSVVRRVVRRGVAVELTMSPMHARGRRAGEFREGDDVAFRFKVSDAATGTALPNVRPAAWMAARREEEPADADSLARKVAGFLRGGRDARPELDLNTYHVLTLNDDATISVVDPLFGFGGTKLLTLIPLRGVGDDWEINADHSRLYVSIPDAGRVAVVETGTWSVLKEIDPGRRPGRLALQPDENYLWVADATDAPGSGVSAIDTRTLALAGSFPTGKGRHEIAFGPDNRLAFVTNRGSGTVSIIDVRPLKKVADLATGPDPVAIASCPVARMVYVAHGRDGTVAAIDPDRRAVVARLRAEPGLGALKFAPGRRLGFLLNPGRNLVHILDAATNRIVQTAETEDRPDQLAFTDRFAYVRHAGSDAVRLIPLDGVGVPGKPVRVVDITGGQNPPGKAARPCLADGIVQASGEGAALVANPADRAIYYYKEGMAAPMGSFSNYGREPRAVLTVDRSLRQREPGVYETVARLGRPGRYDLAFLLENPRVIDGFEVTVAPDPARPSPEGAVALDIEPMVEGRAPRVGGRMRLRLRLVDRATRAPRAGLHDVGILTFLPGRWQRRHHAEPEGPGIYAIDFVPPRPGLYYVHVECPSAGLDFGDGRFFTMEAKETLE